MRGTARPSDASGGGGSVTWRASTSVALVPSNGKPSREGEERRGAESVEIAPRIDLSAQRLFGAHELGRAGDAVAGVAGGRGDAEVGDEHAAGGSLDQDVVGLHVPVDEALRVGGRQGPRHLAQNPRGLRRRQWSPLAHALGEGLAVDERHDVEDESVRVLDGMNRDDVRVGQACREACLAQEALAERAPAPRARAGGA